MHKAQEGIVNVQLHPTVVSQLADRAQRSLFIETMTAALTPLMPIHLSEQRTMAVAIECQRVFDVIATMPEDLFTKRVQALLETKSRIFRERDLRQWLMQVERYLALVYRLRDAEHCTAQEATDWTSFIGLIEIQNLSRDFRQLMKGRKAPLHARGKLKNR